VEVRYASVRGVPIAHRISQVNIAFTGTVRSLDPTNHLMTVRRRGLDKTFELAPVCHVVLREGKAGSFGDVGPGHRVTVTYELPGGKPWAYQIAERSREFTGELTAVDTSDRTLRAKDLFHSKKFNMAKDCAIVINGKPDGRLDDLKLGDKFDFSYQIVDGVNIVNRVAGSEALPRAATASSGQPAGPGAAMPNLN